MSEVDATGSISLAALEAPRRTGESVFSAQVGVLDSLLETQIDLLAEVLKLLGVGNRIDVTA